MVQLLRAREQLRTQTDPESEYGEVHTVQTVVEVQFEQLLGHRMQLPETRENPLTQAVQMVAEVQVVQLTLQGAATVTPV